MRFRYIAIEGPPGVGKSALAERLAEVLGGDAVLEAETNPFLEDALEGRAGAAFQAQIFYLLNRYRQLSGLAQRELFSHVKIADFILARDKIYAYLQLDDTELALYEKIYRAIAPEVPAPELVVYVQAPADTLVKRLRRHPRPVPGGEDLREIVRAYDYFFFHYSATPLLIVSAAELDFADPAAPLDDLMQEIQLMPGGTRYYVPSADS